jgi:hypothetical protein
MKKQNRFRVGQKARIKTSKAIEKLLWRVWLTRGLMGQVVTITALRDQSFGTPPLMCHKTCSDTGTIFWVPPGALEKV